MGNDDQAFWRELAQALFDTFLREYGAGFTLLVLVILVLFYLYQRSHKSVIEAKQGEIERLVVERNWYQGVLTERLTSLKPAPNDSQPDASPPS